MGLANGYRLGCGNVVSRQSSLPLAGAWQLYLGHGGGGGWPLGTRARFTSVQGWQLHGACGTGDSAVGCLTGQVTAQAFRPRGQAVAVQGNPAGAQPNQRSSSVSNDLLQIYGRTQAATTESDLTAIAQASANIAADAARSKVDRQYASSLLAWALNRRGELRSDEAAAVSARGRPELAGRLDAQAAEDFAAAVEHAPGNWRHRHNLAISLALRGDHTQAILQLDRAIELNPEYANAWFNRAELYFELASYAEAVQDYTAALELSQDAQYFNGRAHAHFMLEQFDRAVDDYRRAVELATDHAIYLTDLADACQFLGRWEEAAEAYRAALAIDTHYVRAYQNVAWLMATCPEPRLRNHELALSAAKRVFELSDQRTVEAVDTLAAANAALGRHEEAIKLQAEAIELASRDPNRPAAELQELQLRLEIYQRGKSTSSPNRTRPIQSPRQRPAAR